MGKNSYNFPQSDHSEGKNSYTFPQHDLIYPINCTENATSPIQVMGKKGKTFTPKFVKRKETISVLGKLSEDKYIYIYSDIYDNIM